MKVILLNLFLIVINSILGQQTFAQVSIKQIPEIHHAKMIAV